MDSENRSRADLALPNPQDSSSVPEIELSEAPFRDSTLPEKAAPPPRQTWLTFLKRELEFLGVTQILFAISGFLSIMSEKKNAAYLQAYEDDFCIAAFFSTIPEDRLYEELNIYSPIYSELEDRVETSPTDT
uniref:Membrane spanning 4-domains A2 n=1 Tax=Pipistrellus kuhlii TaxID=59472 RepID=A0A7J7X1D0_PIPKU|nr:membrane spanning 4-domains A2 [Pipistrellus kuhlii]